ncbi:MAG: hypothetical protein AB7G40_06490 [Hyphomonadaceae bacterium]
MSYKLKLGVALGVAALALPTFAFAQDPSTRTDLTIVGAVSTDRLEQIADANATSVAEMPVVYEDEAETANADASATDSTADAAAEAE